MSDHRTELVMPERAPLQTGAVSILDVVARAASDPHVDVAKMERLLAMAAQERADQRRTSYMAALARLQAALPQITKSGTIQDRDGNVRHKFAKIEDIDVVIRPLCAEEGFSFSFDSKPSPSGIAYECAMHHRDGHMEVKSLVLPVDTGGGRSAAQSVGSTTSYARRYLLGMHLNLVTRDEDNDGAGASEPITASQRAQLRGELAAVGGNEARFLNWLAVESFDAIPVSNFARALRFIEEKKRQGGK